MPPADPHAPVGARTGYLARHGFVDSRWVENAYVEVADDGAIVFAGSKPPHDDPAVVLVDLGHAALLPGMVNAHSHAFQRGIRGATQARGQDDPSSFWSWREAMYRAANALDPGGVHEISKLAFLETVNAGITCVGEFHYLHHRPDGSRYADANELSRQVVRAARDVGIRLVLLEVFYERARPGAELLPEQRRFHDGSVDDFLTRVDDLRGSGVPVGIAPHSVRAVTPRSLESLAEYAHRHGLPLHAHVSEQPKDNEICLAETGRTPTRVLADAGCLSRPRTFTAVHAIFLDDGDHDLLADQIVCACPTTEADLGDGIVPVSRLSSDGATLALGTDSNAIIDLIQEARLLEMNERLRTGTRLCLTDENGRTAPRLLEAATVGGATSLGRDDLGRLREGAPFDAFTVDLGHAAFAAVDTALALDSLMTTGTAAPVDRVFVGGRRVV